MDIPLSREELGALKSRLAADPTDESARDELVTWYRRNGDVDQAGRFAIAVEGLATEHEVRAYAVMLRGLGADDRRMRALSRLPDDPATAERVRQELDAASAPSRTRVLDAVAWVAWIVFVFVLVVTVIATFVLALRGDPQVHDAAVTMSVITLFALALACGVSAIALAIERMRIAAAVFGVLFMAALAVALLLLDG